MQNRSDDKSFRVEARLAAIIDSSDDAIVSKSLDGIIQTWNKAAERIFGWTADEVIGKPITVIIPPDRLDEEPKILSRIQAGERVDHFETIRMAKNGRRVNVSVTISPIRDGNGHVIGASKIARDITGLREFERQISDFVENATVGMHWVGPDGIVLWANRCELELLGYAKEEYVGRHISEFHADQTVIQEILARLARGESLTNQPARMQCKNGDIRHVLINSCARFENGQFRNTQCFTRDVTALRIAEDQRRVLFEKERAARAAAEREGGLKDEFLATLSHELRTPLSAILGYAQLIRKGSVGPNQMIEAVSVIERNARMQSQMIEDLLDLSRIIAGKVRLDVQRVDLAAVVSAALDSVRPAADLKGVRLTSVLDPLVGPVRGDPARLQQAVWNLLTNAIKFTPRDGKVQVALERVNSHVEIEVSDTGEGINPDFLPHVFDRFRQAEGSSTRRYGGLGIGLSIVRQLVELHGGSVRAKSPGAGKGSTFNISLPLRVSAHDDQEPRAHPKLASTPASPCENIDLSGIRVLVVDDEADARELISRILQTCGAQVVAAGSVNEAVSLIRSGVVPDVLVSDLGMPDHDGYELIRTVRALQMPEAARIPAIALSAFARSEDRRRAMMAGFQMHVAKPVEMDELLAVVASLAGRIGQSN